jgi:hypothetical protein
LITFFQKKNPAALSHRGVFQAHCSCSCFDRLPATAATTTAATATRTARTAATTAAAATATTALTFLRFINTQWTTAHILTVQGLDGALCVSARHFHKAEATRTTRFAIVNQRD